MKQTGDRNRTWRAEQKRQFGRRLEAARIRAGYRKAIHAISAMQERWPDLIGRTYYAHEGGTRVPDDDVTIERYAEFMGVTREFLLFGTGETLASADLNEPLHSVNQPSEMLHIITSQSGVSRYIPVVTASDILNLIQTGRLSAMSGEHLPVPAAADAGARAFYYRMPYGDHSMVGTHPPIFPPGIVLMFDPDRELAPNDFLLAWMADKPLFRRLDSAHAFFPERPIFPFSLVALNVHARPIQVVRSGICRILGRMISATQLW